MKKYIDLIKREIDFINLVLKNKEIPSVVVLTLFGRKKKLEELLESENT